MISPSTLATLGKIAKAIIEYAPKVLWIASSVKSLFSGASGKEVGEIESYDNTKATLDDKIEMANLLSKIKNRALQKADDVEESLINFCEDTIDKFIDMLEENDISGSSLNGVNRLGTKVSRIIHEHLKRQITLNISLDNTKCLEVLKLPAGGDKENQMQTLIKDSIAKGVTAVKNDINIAFQDAIESIREKFQDKIDRQKELAQSNLLNLKDFQESHNLESRQSKQIALLEELSTIELGLKVL